MYTSSLHQKHRKSVPLEQSGGERKRKPAGKHIEIAHILSASQLLCAILQPRQKPTKQQQKLATKPSESASSLREAKGSEPTLRIGRDPRTHGGHGKEHQKNPTKNRRRAARPAASGEGSNA
jgi:hypothetical protein